LIIILCPVVAWSGDISINSVDKMMALSGLNRQVSALPEMINIAVEKASQLETSVVPDAVSDDLRKDIEKAFHSSEILKIVGQEIKQNFSEAEARKILDWLDSDIGRKITKAQAAASTSPALDVMTRNATYLIADQERLALAEKMENVLHASDMTTQIRESTSLAAFMAVSAVKEPGQRRDIKAFKSELSEKMQEEKPHMMEMIILFNIYAYKDIDIAVIEKYIKYLESPAARKFNATVIKGMEKALIQSIDKMIKSFSADLKKYNESGKKQP
jgi:hypothetical protein